MTPTNTPKEVPMQGRKGDWMQTYTGRKFWPLDPKPLEVEIEDIARSLALQCRYAGHTLFPYSVAQHSVLLSRLVTQRHALAALLHDAPEAYVVDVPRPLKAHLPAHSEIEHGVWLAVAERFGLPPALPAEVKAMDDAILHAERAQVMRKTEHDWAIREPPVEVKIEPWHWRDAELAFLDRFRELAG